MTARHLTIAADGPMWTQNPRHVVVVTRRSAADHFEIGEAVQAPGGAFRSFRCRECGHKGTCRAVDVPGPHVCPEEGRHACTCRATVLVKGVSRFFIDGTDIGCPVHGGQWRAEVGKV